MPHRASTDGPGPYRILLVDDNEEILRTLALLLARQGHDVHSMTTVAAALTAGDSFDLVISDVSLPDGSGLDLMRELKERGAIKGIALSGLTSRLELEQVKAAGFARCLAKPISFEDLSRVIHDVMAES